MDSSKQEQASPSEFREQLLDNSRQGEQNKVTWKWCIMILFAAITVATLVFSIASPNTAGGFVQTLGGCLILLLVERILNYWECSVLQDFVRVLVGFIGLIIFGVTPFPWNHCGIG